MAPPPPARLRRAQAHREGDLAVRANLNTMSVSTEVQRTLVKSPPELWAELSDPAALMRHLGELGEIRITSVEPETKVEWEAEDASGVVQLEAFGVGHEGDAVGDTHSAEPPRT